MSIPRVLSIAGSDSGAGAGIQADLKAFAALRRARDDRDHRDHRAEHGRRDRGPPDPAGVIVAQVRAVADDIGVDAVKIGMLGDRATIEAVAQALDGLPDGTPVVLDPVMVAESGAQLLDPAAKSALIDLLLPRATVVTPNVPEARALVADLARERSTSKGSPEACTRWGPKPSSSPAATATTSSTSSSTATGWSSSTASATRTGRRTVRGAPTPRC